MLLGHRRKPILKFKFMDTDKLEAGPELDALVAEKVMGWTVGLGIFRDQYGTIRNSQSTFEQYEPSIRWQPSTDIRDAWEVVEKMRGNHTFFIESYPVGETWWAQFTPLNVDEEYHGGASTVPLAICRAALKSVTK